VTAWISHVEWHCRDAQAVADFLTALLGWAFAPHGRRYREAIPADGPRIGLLQVDVLPAGETQQAFIAVSELDMVLARARVLGGEVAEMPVTIPGYGRYARMRAPDGTVLGLFEAAMGTRPS
jgi:predicted enzyme related to lactoylglutathione lyase